MGGKYSHSAGWAREAWALAVFVGGFVLYDARAGGDGARIVALMMMLVAAAFLCFAVVERMFFLPRLRRKEDPADPVEHLAAASTPRHADINYDGPQTPRGAGQNTDFSGPDGLDPVPPPRHAQPPDPRAAASSASASSAPAHPEAKQEEAEPHPEDEHESRAELESTLSDSFFGSGKK